MGENTVIFAKVSANLNVWDCFHLLFVGDVHDCVNELAAKTRGSEVSDNMF